MTQLQRIAVDPNVCGGRPAIRGLRIRVKHILDMLASGASREQILADYPVPVLTRTFRSIRRAVATMPQGTPTMHNYFSNVFKPSADAMSLPFPVNSNRISAAVD